jgi:hypothetical protein
VAEAVGQSWWFLGGDERDAAKGHQDIGGLSVGGIVLSR